jgi:hypothetical protein
VESLEINVMSEPSTASEITAQLGRGDFLQIVRDSCEWLEIVYGEDHTDAGWVHCSSVSWKRVRKPSISGENAVAAVGAFPPPAHPAKTQDCPTLHVPGLPYIAVAFTEDGLDEMATIAADDEDKNVAEWLLEGNGFLVPNGTRIAVLRETSTKAKVLIVDGEMIGSVGWAATDSIRE